jgi:transcriptional regulator with XRE-family HTH domain
LELGYRLKVLREAFGLSQRELAKRAGITNSNISMIEQGQISPSVQSLTKILDVFPVSLAEFFSNNLISDRSPVIYSSQMPADVSPEGALVRSCFQEGLTGDIRLSRMSIPSGSGDLIKPALQDIAGWVLSGELNLHLATRVFIVAKGDGFYIKREQLHRFVNAHAEMLELVVASLVSKQ